MCEKREECKEETSTSTSLSLPSLPVTHDIPQSVEECRKVVKHLSKQTRPLSKDEIQQLVSPPFLLSLSLSLSLLQSLVIEYDNNATSV